MCQSLEKQIFSWNGWDEVDAGILQFYNVELSIPVGEFPVGEKFDCAVFSNLNSELVLIKNDENGSLINEYKYSIIINIQDNN